MKALEDLGLTGYEAKTYYSLLSTGLSEAKVICNHSGVPWGRIYDVLNSLEGKGLVESQSSRPKQFLPVEPRVALENLLKLKNREIEVLTDKATRIEYELNELYQKPPQESMFWNVTMGQDMAKAILEKIAEVKDELLLYLGLTEALPGLTDKEQQHFLNILDDLVNNKVKIKVLIGINDVEKQEELLAYMMRYIGLQGKVEVKITSIITSCFDIMDKEKAFVKIPNPINPKEYFASIYIW